MTATMHLTRSLSAIVMVLIAMPAVAPAQSVSSGMAVSARILPPVDTRPPRLISVSVARTGLALLETAAPIAGGVSQIVMVTISSPTNSFAPVTQPAALVKATHRNWSGAGTAPSDTSATQRMGFVVDVGRPPTDSAPHAVSVRITYLIVPGT